jgi:hypothetical protein
LFALHAHFHLFDLDYVNNRVKVAENFARIMGFVLAGANDSDDPIAFAMGSLRERVAQADCERFVSESEWSGVGKARKANIASSERMEKKGGSKVSGTWKTILTANRCEHSPPTSI